MLEPQNELYVQLKKAYQHYLGLYQKRVWRPISEDLTLETTWGFPSRFHPILGFIIAGYITAGVDADDIYARMSPEHKMAAKVIEGNMRRWNNSLVLHSMNNSAAEEPEDVGVSLSMM
jgi:hypothetical protein